MFKTLDYLDMSGVGIVDLKKLVMELELPSSIEVFSNWKKKLFNNLLLNRLLRRALDQTFIRLWTANRKAKHLQKPNREIQTKQ